MCQVKLLKASKELLERIKLYKEDFFNHNETTINGSSGLHRATDYDKWLDTTITKETKLINNRVLATTFFLYRPDDDKIIGSCQLRHSLTEELKQHGGHIGYSISPSERGKGYAKIQLLLVLEEARKMNISELLLTCDETNVGSYKTIESCGGVLLDHNVYEGMKQKRYSIIL